MMAFYEAIGGYSRTRGAFLKYASMLIRNRLIDDSRKERRHGRVISLDAPAGNTEMALGETLAEDRDRHEEAVSRDATRAEIEALTRQMQEFGVSLSDVADQLPQAAAHAGGVPEGAAICEGKSGALGGPPTNEAPADRPPHGRQWRRTQDAGTAQEIYGGPCAGLY